MYYADPCDEGASFASLLRRFALFVCPVILLYACSSGPEQSSVAGKPAITGDSTAGIKRDSISIPKPAKKKKKVYLTFDDGPNKGTKNVLDIVKEEEVPVTFFIVGEHVFASRAQGEIWDSLKIARNIALCNHSYTHAHNRYAKFYQQPDSVVKDVRRTNSTLMPDNNIVRTPGRNCWRIDTLSYTDNRKSRAAVDSLQKAGFIVVGWDLEWHYDRKTYKTKQTADELISQIDSAFAKGKMRVKDNLVILAHDQVYQKSDDSSQLRDFIQKLKKKEEYELALVSSYPGIAPSLADTITTGNGQ